MILEIDSLFESNKKIRRKTMEGKSNGLYFLKNFSYQEVGNV